MTVPPNENYAAQWHEHRRRYVALFFAMLGFIPGMAGVGSILGRLFGSDAPFTVIAILWIVASGVILLRARSWPCPRCRKPYSASGLFYDPLAKRCLHCGLPKNAER